MKKTIKWGILGTGNIAHKFAEGLRNVNYAEIFAVGSRNLNTALEFGSHYNISRAYGSYEGLSKDQDVDVIYIATPHNLHFSNTMMCLNNGKHVLCEKPFAVNGFEVRQMIQKAREKNLFLMEAMWSRFIPHIIKAKELINAGTIGEIKLLKADFGINFPFDETHRVYNRELIGGSLMDVGIYPVFLSLLLFGKPKLIKAIAGLGPTSVDHNCSISFQYDKDLITVLYSSIVARTPVTAEIFGTKGKITFDEWWFTPVPIHHTDEHGESCQIKLNYTGNGYNYEADEVVKCILSGKNQSELMTWSDSLLLIDTLDEIRSQCNIIYPDHDNPS
ncbi:MAG: Gfo/Idh/MocA family oxidoreductase [Bacteroidales bacterium]|nr:Gfo/Idh/MocA family oxidoreductase [Bacteroidales bacterium]